MAVMETRIRIRDMDMGNTLTRTMMMIITQLARFVIST